MSLLDKIEKRLNENDKHRLKSIFAPTVVSVPIENARRNFCVMPDGEIRSYGLVDKTAILDEGMGGREAYLSSQNGGLDWKLVIPDSRRIMGAAVRNPHTGRYLSVHHRSLDNKEGAFVRYSDISPDDPDFIEKEIPLGGEKVLQMLHPIYLPARRRWVAASNTLDGIQHPIVFFSDDDGESWSFRHLNAVPFHEPAWPHQGMRWQNTGVEPTVVEREDGSLLLLARASQDYLYQYFSFDGGESWTAGEPSHYHCTLTSPAFLKLENGKILLFWNNTRPLAELDHKDQPPEMGNGSMEDYFTNRDANHVAISNDGIHTEAMRELFLNGIRNAADFRLNGGALCCNDKSVHQFTAIELPYGKVLVIFGQHDVSRRAVIFDVRWLYEKERHEDLQRGLEALSTHLYVKSVAGHSREPFGGHCAYNRTNGALLVPDPDNTEGEALQICRINDPRLVSSLQGAVWNFPAAKAGTLVLQMRVGGAGLLLSLCDHWINPSDPYAKHYAAFTVRADEMLMEKDVWHTAELSFDLDEKSCSVAIDGAVKQTARLENEAPLGLSYLHMQTLAEDTDFCGSYVRRLDFCAK